MQSNNIQKFTLLFGLGVATMVQWTTSRPWRNWTFRWPRIDLHKSTERSSIRIFTWVIHKHKLWTWLGIVRSRLGVRVRQFFFLSQNSLEMFLLSLDSIIFFCSFVLFLFCLVELCAPFFVLIYIVRVFSPLSFNNEILMFYLQTFCCCWCWCFFFNC